jgi:hypothetical protein
VDLKLYDPLKEHIGDFHWSPAEAFALGQPADTADTGSAVRSKDLAVISWALCQTGVPCESGIPAPLAGQRR